MRILTLTTLYPNAAMPRHGVFVENRLRAFIEKSKAEVRVCAPVPWFPFKGDRFGEYAKWAQVPKQEIRHSINVDHPRYTIPPKLGMTFSPNALKKCFLKAAQHAIENNWDFDLIDAHYLYPDGVAAMHVAKKLGKPIVLTARGTDVNLIPKFPRQKTMILDAVRNADAVVCVASALKDELVRLGAPAEKIEVMRNGVDLELFKPQNRDACRAKYDLKDAPTLLSVGHLIDRKGHDLVIETLSSLPDAKLLIAGDGEKYKSLLNQAQDQNVANRVIFVGAIPHEELPAIYTAADCLVLASSREGWPNVLLEAMACGTPAIAAPIWGCGEVITAPEAGSLASDRSSAAIAKSVSDLLVVPPLREQTRAYAEKFSWDETARRQEVLFRRLIAEDQDSRRITSHPIMSVSNDNQPRLLITVDTEEEFNWQEFNHTRFSVCPPDDLSPFQEICQEVDAKPIYFLTYPLLEEQTTAEYFSNLHQQGRAEIGLHMHQWVTPPIDGFLGEYYSYQMNLPREVHAKKLSLLADFFEQRIGTRATVHRAGRYGIKQGLYPDLAENGIIFDFSPSPGSDQSPEGGPNFAHMSNQPFAIETDSGKIWVTPVSGSRAVKGTRHFIGQKNIKPGFSFPNKPAKPFDAGIRLTCEGTTLEDLKALTAHLLAENTPVLTYSLHSTTLTVGANTCSPDAASVDRALDLTRAYFDYYKNDLGGSFINIEDLKALYGVKV